MTAPGAAGPEVERRAALLLEWYSRHARDLPWRRTRDPYAIWVSEVMLQQTQVATVIPYWERWMRDLPDLRALAAAPEQQVLKLWEGLGYYRRVRHLQAAAAALVSSGRTTVPESAAEFLELPGVGRYTAGAVTSIAYGRPEPVLDGNVIRVLTRLSANPADPGKAPVREGLWSEAAAWVQAGFRFGGGKGCGDLNQALMELGATVCTPRSPACPTCPLSSECEARRQGCPEMFPRLGKRVASTPRWFVVIVPLQDERAGVRRRATGEVNGGLWEFPNIEVEGPATDASAAARRVLGRPVGSESLMMLGTVRHAITRYRVTQWACAVRWKGRAAGWEWKGVDELDALAFPSAHRRLAARVVTLLRGGELHAG